MPEKLKRYELFGWDYEAITPQDPAEIVWHETWARRSGGPVLVLACGTGRLVCRLAERGFVTVGLDLSDTMLRLARRNVRELPSSVRRRIQLIRADMTDFRLADRFGLIAIPDNSFREVGTRARMRRCLRPVRAHLTPTGALLVTERRFDAGAFPRSGNWSREMVHPKTGARLARRLDLRLTHSGRRIVGRFQYCTTLPDGSKSVTDCPVNLPALTTEEYLLLLRNAGFDAHAHAGYREEEGDQVSSLVCFVCTPSASLRGRQDV